jgi:hypothetical protein
MTTGGGFCISVLKDEACAIGMVHEPTRAAVSVRRDSLVALPNARTRCDKDT